MAHRRERLPNVHVTVGIGDPPSARIVPVRLGTSLEHAEHEALLARNLVDSGVPSTADHRLRRGRSRQRVGILQPLRDLVGAVVEGVLIFALRVIDLKEDASN